VDSCTGGCFPGCKGYRREQRLECRHIEASRPKEKLALAAEPSPLERDWMVAAREKLEPEKSL